MKLALAGLATKSIHLDLPGSGDGEPHRVQVEEAHNLRGFIENLDGVLRLSEVLADAIVLARLEFGVGPVRIATSPHSALRSAQLDVEQSPEGFDLALRVAGFDSTCFRIEVEAIARIETKVRLSDATLDVRGGAGGVGARVADLTDFRVRLGGLEIECEFLSARPLEIKWGASGFHLDGSEVVASGLRLRAAGTALRIANLRAERVIIHGANITIDGVAADEAEVDIDFPAAPPSVSDSEAPDSPTASAPPTGNQPTGNQPTGNQPTGNQPTGNQPTGNQPTGNAARTPPLDEEEAPPSRESPPLFKYDMLDRLSGHLHVDATVDATVPIIRRRRATHRLRLPIESGTINYRELEGALAGLEDSLLDFSLRGDQLVLELGIPLLPTRGLGKPLIRWRLSPFDVELAKQRRVRLSVLPNLATDGSESTKDASARTASPSHPPSPPGQTASHPPNQTAAHHPVPSSAGKEPSVREVVGSAAKKDASGASGSSERGSKSPPAIDKPSQPARGNGRGPVELLELSLTNLETELNLGASPTPMASVLRNLAFDCLVARGSLHHHHVENARDGRIEGRVEALELDLAELPLDAHRVDVAALRIGAVREYVVRLRGVRPERVQLRGEELSLRTFRLVRR